jgi:hypothetical protein
VGIRHALIGAAATALIAAALPSEARADGAAAEGASARPITIALATDEAALAALGISIERLMYHTRIEASAVVVAAPAPAALRAFVDPGTDGLSVAITVEDRARARTDSRVIPLADVAASDRARVVALGLAEVVRAFAVAPAPPTGARAQAAQAAPIPAAAIETPSATPAESPPTGAVDVTVGAIGFPADGAWLIDPRAGVERRLSGALWARADVGVWIGGAQDALGDARLTVPSLGLGLMWRIDPTRALTLGAGPMLDVGVAFGSADARAASRAAAETALTLRASLAADMRVRIVGPLALTAGASAGGMLRGAELRADDRVLLAATGFCVAGRAGALVVFP